MGVIKKKGFFYLINFVFLFTFFIIIHPLIIYNTDDWYFSSYMRRALPIWGDFNPIKVFPETFMSAVGFLGAYIFYPLLGYVGYVRSLSIAYGLILCMFIMAYIIVFDIFIRNQFKLSDKESTFVTWIFLLFHFLFFKTNTYNNEYLFTSIDIACYYHYVIPEILNCIMVMCLWNNKDVFSIRNSSKFLNCGWIVLGIYLALFSNLYANAILAIFAGTCLVLDFIKSIQKKDVIKDFIKRNVIYLSILIVWFITLLFELNGKRAGDLTSNSQVDIGGAINSMLNLLRQTNKFFLLVAGLFVLVTSVLIFLKKDKVIFEEGVRTSMSAVLMFIYVILLSARVQPSYGGRSDIFLGIGFYVLMLVGISMAYIIKQCPQCMMLLPMLCFILTIQTINGSKSFRECNGYSLSWEQCLAVDNYMVDEVIAADKRGDTEVVLKVSKGNENAANWPHATYLGTLMSDTLFRHGVISKPMKIEIVPSNEINERFGLTY